MPQPRVPRPRMPAALALLAVLTVLTGCVDNTNGPPTAAPQLYGDGPAVPVASGSFTAVVTRVVDGDTVIAQVDGTGPKLRVRLLGFDTPETVKPDTPVACFGHAASALTKALLTGVTIRAAYEVEHTDVYRRELWDVWLPGGQFLATAIVASGAARVLPYSPNTFHAAEIAAAQALAQRDHRGLWGACDVAKAFPQLARGTRQ